MAGEDPSQPPLTKGGLFVEDPPFPKGGLLGEDPSPPFLDKDGLFGERVLSIFYNASVVERATILKR